MFLFQPSNSFCSVSLCAGSQFDMRTMSPSECDQCVSECDVETCGINPENEQCTDRCLVVPCEERCLDACDSCFDTPQTICDSNECQSFFTGAVRRKIQISYRFLLILKKKFLPRPQGFLPYQRRASHIHQTSSMDTYPWTGTLFLRTPLKRCYVPVTTTITLINSDGAYARSTVNLVQMPRTRQHRCFTPPPP